MPYFFPRSKPPMQNKWSGHSGESLNESLWSEEDQASFHKTLHRVKQETLQLPFFGAPEVSTLLSMPQNVSDERTFQLFTILNIATALMLSGTIDVALNPITVSTLPEDQQYLGDLYNGLAMFTVIANFGGFMYSTYTLLMLASSPPATIHRTLAHMGQVWSIPLTLIASMMSCVALVFISGILHSSRTGAKVSIAVSAFLYLAFHCHWCHWVPRAFPQSLPWALIMAPWEVLRSGYRMDAKRLGCYMFANAPCHFKADRDNACRSSHTTSNASGASEHVQHQTTSRGEQNAAGGSESDDRNASIEEREALRELLKRALRRTDDVRRQLIEDAMLNAQLMLNELCTAGQSGTNGATLVFSSLDLAEFGVRLLPGERLALAAAIMQEAAIATTAKAGSRTFSHYEALRL